MAMRVDIGVLRESPIAVSDARKAGLANVASIEDREPKAAHLVTWFLSARLAKKESDVRLAFWPRRVRQVQVKRMLSPCSKVSDESGSASIHREPTHALRREIPVSESRSVPNQAPEPTPPLVTVRADARLAPSGVVAHL